MKEKLLEAKEKIINLALEDVKKGKHTMDLYNIITAKIKEIEFAEKEEERKATNKEINELLVKTLGNF